ncbi:MAG: hypothetical protein PHP44_10110 [Kiritimatiellae bacterium]|nr:hypothetical protein [Kiritimatiellia bacterium]
MNKGRNRSICVVFALLVLCLPASRADMVIDLAYIGNAGNSADTTGNGSVGYNYYIVSVL